MKGISFSWRSCAQGCESVAALPSQVVSGSVSPSGTTKTTRTTTYSVRAVPVSTCVVVGEGVWPPQGEHAATTHGGEFGSVDELKKYIEEKRSKLMEDPRTKQMIERGEVRAR